MDWRGFGFVHHSRTIFCRAVPNLSITIRHFFIAVSHTHLAAGKGWEEAAARMSAAATADAVATATAARVFLAAAVAAVAAETEGGAAAGRRGVGQALREEKKKNTLRRCGCVERGHASARVSTRDERTNARRSAVDAKTQTALLRELGGCRRYRLI
jgi:hypothetical protein